ncbi:MAG: hypothetical protein ACFFD4_31685 [Candidatus Odinarchaeota archaeon]
MNFIDRDRFKELRWKRINIFYRGKHFLTVPRTDYYSKLTEFITPLTNFEQIKCYYFGLYPSEIYLPPNEYHINFRFGCFHSDWEGLERAIRNFCGTKSNVLIIDPLDAEKTKEFISNESSPVLIEIDSDLDIKSDKKRFCFLPNSQSDKPFDEQAYYLFIIHWYTGSAYFLKALEHGLESFNKPGFDLYGLPHLQWNLMGSRYLSNQNGNQTIFSEGIIQDDNSGRGTVDAKGLRMILNFDLKKQQI